MKGLQIKRLVLGFTGNVIFLVRLTLNMLILSVWVCVHMCVSLQGHVMVTQPQRAQSNQLKTAANGGFQTERAPYLNPTADDPTGKSTSQKQISSN